MAPDSLSGNDAYNVLSTADPSMKRPAIFFDRDNTLIVCDGYLGDPSKVVLVRGASAAVAAARRMGFATVVVSNQSGVARGLFSEDDVRRVNARMDALLAAEDPAAIIDRHEYCPFHPKGKIDAYRKESDLRKPKPGMILNAARLLAVDLRQSWMVGDTPRDLEAGRAAGCRVILFSDPALPASPAAEAPGGPVYADYVVSKLADAMEFIGRNRVRPDEGDHSQNEAAIATLPSLADSADMDPEIAPPSMYTINRPAGRSAAQPAAAANSTDDDAAMGATADPAPMPQQPFPPQPTDPSLVRVENLLRELLAETRRRNEMDLHADFSVVKVLAGIAQVVSIAVLFFAYLNRADQSSLTLLLVAIVLQLLTISLTIMGKQR